jgi:hypothetical protein
LYFTYETSESHKFTEKAVVDNVGPYKWFENGYLDRNLKQVILFVV